MDTSSQFIVPTIIDVPELIVTNDDIDFDETNSIGGRRYWNKLHILASALSYTINLGALWRFPYLCYKHGGGAFLASYSLMLAIIGLPLFLMELAFGQYANEGPITIWRISPAFEGIGYSMCLISASVSIYYNLINSWLIHYLFASLSLTGTLSWTGCDQSWNTAKCFLRPDPGFVISVARGNSTRGVNNCTTPTTSSSPSSSSNPMTTITSLINSSSAPFSSPSNQTQQSTLTTLANYTWISSSTNNPNGLLINPSASAGISPVTAIGPGAIVGPHNCSSSGSDFETFERIISSVTGDEVVLPANEYFHNSVLEISESASDLGSLNWSSLACLTIVWAMVLVLTLRSFRLQGGWAFLALVAPFLALGSLVARGLTLPGAGIGLTRYLAIDWFRFSGVEIWSDALSQVFFAISPCWGGLIQLANMNKFHNNFHSDALLIVSSNYLVSLLSGVAIFATLGYMADYSGIAFEQVADSGPGLIFQVLPEALATVPLASLNATLLFAILLFNGLSSQLGLLDTVISTIVDTWPHKLRYRKPLILMLTCSGMWLFSVCAFCFGNAAYLIQWVDTFAGTFSAALVGLTELIAIAWVYGIDNFMQDIDDMVSVHRSLFPGRQCWYFLWRYLTPSCLFAIVVFSFTDLQPTSYRSTNPLPDWSLRLGWTLSLASLAAIPVIALLRLLFSPGSNLLDKVSYLCRPSEDWAPSSYVSGPKLINRHQQHDNGVDDDETYGPNDSLFVSSSPDPSSPGASSSAGAGIASSSRGSRLAAGLKSISGAARYNNRKRARRSHKQHTRLAEFRDSPSSDDNLHPTSSRVAQSGLLNIVKNKARPYQDVPDYDEDDDDRDEEEEEEEDDDDDDDEDLKVVNGKANYIIPEEDDTDTELATNETNV